MNDIEKFLTAPVPASMEEYKELPRLKNTADYVPRKYTTGRKMQVNVEVVKPAYNYPLWGDSDNASTEYGRQPAKKYTILDTVELIYTQVKSRPIVPKAIGRFITFQVWGNEIVCCESNSDFFKEYPYKILYLEELKDGTTD